jgi:O-acetyl-ADP-ribose deacetylase (regulator of RNase III)
MIVEIAGDIVSNIDTTKKTVILHGCNCKHIMGGGIALYLRRLFPIIYTVDKATKMDDITKLGTFSVANINNNLTILNCYTQFGIGIVDGIIPVDYIAIDKCMETISEMYKDYEIRIPKIGCGLAGGDWNIVKEIIIYNLHDNDVILYSL